jgi:hypothetical protein
MHLSFPNACYMLHTFVAKGDDFIWVLFFKYGGIKLGKCKQCESYDCGNLYRFLTMNSQNKELCVPLFDINVCHPEYKIKP